jgi:acyl carrier protein
VRGVFKLDSSIDVKKTGLGLVSGWDSLGHLGLVIEIERSLGITLTAAEMHQTERFADLVAICSRKMIGSDR